MSELVLFFNTNPVLVTFVWTVLWAVLSFGLGIFFGHWLAKGRDKRKEFNDIADVVRSKLRNHQRIIARGETPSYLGNVTTQEYDELRDVIAKRKKSALAKAWSNYESAQQNCGGYSRAGFYEFHSPEILSQAIAGLLAFVDRK